MNYFELFEIPVSFSIDQTKLTRTYIQLQKKFHPDFYGQSSDEDREFSLEQSSEVNKAYRTLKNPDLTMKYFLQLKGLIEEGEQYKLPPAFLMEVMDLNEMKMDGADKETVESKSKELMGEILGDIKDLLENYDDVIATPEDHLRIKDYYYKKKYIDRLLEE
jgi:molecular chaperone HscB